jgi:hypothetical protein
LSLPEPFHVGFFYKAVTVKKFELTRTIPSGLKLLEMVMSPALLTNAPFSRVVMN